MILQKTTVARIDKKTGLILKRIETSNGIYGNRRLAVNNTFYNAEKSRLLFRKPIFNELVQTRHIHYDKKRGAWGFPMMVDTIEEAQAHAEKQKRIFSPYLQMTKDMWESLTWDEAENNCLKLARRGSPTAPYPLPLDGNLKEWEKRKKTILSLLNKSQELMPVMCSYHNTSLSLPIMLREFQESKLFGVHYFDLKSPTTQANLNAIHQITSNLGVGKEVPLVIGFCPQRYIRSFQNASSSYLLSLFGIDVVSYYVASPAQVSKIEEEPPEEYPFYDTVEGGYNKTATQVAWYGRDLTRTQLEAISTNEGLEPFMAHRWADFMREQEDLKLLNDGIINGTAKEIIEAKSRWSVARESLISNGDNFTL